MTSNNSNSGTDLIIPDGLSIQTADGKTLTGQDLYLAMAEHLPGGSGNGQPLFRFGVTQGVRDPRFPGKDLTLFITRRVRVDGVEEKVTETFGVGEPGQPVRVWAIGFAMNRSYFASKYDPNNPAEPDCRSESFFAPDARYAGKYATQCATRDPRTGRLIATCPLAQWGAKDPNTGKSTPPQCAEQYVVCFAVSVVKQEGAAPEMELVEGYFKSSSASAGKTLVQGLTSLRLKGESFWAHPVDLVPEAVGQGVKITPRLLMGLKTEIDPETEEAFFAAAARWEQALKIRAERALALPDAPQPDGESVASLAGFGDESSAVVMPAGDVAVSAPATGNGKGAKNGKTSKPLI